MSKFYYVLSMTILYIAVTEEVTPVPNPDEVSTSGVFERSAIRNIDKKSGFIFDDMTNSGSQKQCFINFVNNKISTGDANLENLVKTWWLCKKYQNFLVNEALDLPTENKTELILSKAQIIKDNASGCELRVPGYLNYTSLVGTLTNVLHDQSEAAIDEVIDQLKSAINDLLQIKFDEHVQSHPC